MGIKRKVCGAPQISRIPTSSYCVKTPRGCHGLVPLEVHGRCYTGPSCWPKDATGLPRGDSRSLLHKPVASLDPTMASLGPNNSAFCSSKRESPRDKPVASSEFSQSLRRWVCAKSGVRRICRL